MYSHNFPWKWCLKVIPQQHLLHLYFSYLSFSYLSSVRAGGQVVPCVNSVTWLMWSVKQRCGALLCKISIIVLKKQNYLCNTSDWIIMATLSHTLPRPGLFASDAKNDSRVFYYRPILIWIFTMCKASYENKFESLRLGPAVRNRRQDEICLIMKKTTAFVGIYTSHSFL